MIAPAPTAPVRIEAIKAELARLGSLRPGHLSRQYNVCGNPRCRCKADPPRKHGPYYQLSYTWQGRSRTEFVRREDLPTVRQQVRNYQRLRALVENWIAAELEHARADHRQALPKRSNRRRASAVSKENRS
jgi:Family of unknown function (DUF6788)